MTSRLSIAARFLPAILACFLALQPTLVAADLESVSPDEGTVGTSLELRLSGELGKGKPKVWLTLAGDESKKPKKTKLKVTDVIDEGGGVMRLVAAFKNTKTGAGVYDLHVKPKGKGLVEQAFDDAFTVLAPTIDGVTPDTAAPKGEVTITGTALGGGAKKPKVRLAPVGGGKAKKASVTQANGDASLVVKLPKLTAGMYDVLVSNAVGDVVASAALTVTGSGGPGGGGGNMVTATLSSGEALVTTSYVAKNNGSGVAQAFSVPSSDGPKTIITSGMKVGAEEISFSMAFLFEAGVTPTPFTIDVDDVFTGFNIAASQTQPDVSWYTDDGVPGTLTVTSATSSQIQGTFEFDVPPGSVMPASDNLTFMNGTFDVSIQ